MVQLNLFFETVWPKLPKHLTTVGRGKNSLIPEVPGC